MAAELTDERAAFEAWWQSSGLTKYRDTAFAAWEAALATQRATQGAEPVATLHDDGYYTFKRGKEPHGARYAGWRLDVYPAPPPTAEVEKKAARYDWLRNDASEDEQNRWLYRLPEQADEYADKRIAALQSDQAQARKGDGHDQ